LRGFALAGVYLLRFGGWSFLYIFRKQRHVVSTAAKKRQKSTGKLAIPVMVMNSLRMGCRKMGEIEAQPGYILGKDCSAGAAIPYTIIGALRRASDHRS
jgi:hypothetical protein